MPYFASFIRYQSLIAWFAACMVSYGLQAESQDISSETNKSATFAFGSCARDQSPQPVWELIRAENPQLVMLLGDNVYADTTDVNVMKSAYERLASKPEFAALRRQVPILATWDDHDYGANDAGADYPMRRMSQQVFASFWYPEQSSFTEQQGVYHSREYRVGELTVQVIMLDTRYHRSPIKRGLFGYQENNDPHATILGESQWRWLRSQLTRPADLRFIGSSIQFVAKDHGYEKWANFPQERQKMLDLISETRAGGVIFLSGDRHHAEISALNLESLAYPIYDITSSGLTNRLDPALNTEYNEYRIADTFAYRQRNYGLIQVIDGEQPSVQITIKDAYGDELEAIHLKLHDLQYFKRFSSLQPQSR